MIILTIMACKKTETDNSVPNQVIVTDVDGNVYHTVMIGDQEWMVENLKTTKFDDGVLIPQVTDSVTWRSVNTPGYCWLNNDSCTHRTPYGALYNWYAVNTGKLAPKGWHVPTNLDIAKLFSFLEGDTIAGGKLKEAGMEHWKNPNIGANNISGFTALPGSYRSPSCGFGVIGSDGYWWLQTAYNSVDAEYMTIGYREVFVFSSYLNEHYGFSVRCLKNQCSFGK